jgi:hypothetical protein
VIVERPSLERRVVASLDAGRIPVVLGGCGSGRTSLLLRLQEIAGRDRAQYLDLAASATTPERCLAAITAATRLPGMPRLTGAPASPRAAFDLLLTGFDQAASSASGPVTFLIDEFQDIRTFENFPGLRHVQRELVGRLASSPARFVLASRFTSRAHRLLRDAPPRFEVMHLPPLDGSEVRQLALRFNSDRGERTAPQVAVAVASLAAGRAAYATILLDAIAAQGPSMDPVAAMAALYSPDGRLTARCRESYELRLHRARGYGALKAILGILAETEPLTLTEISQQLHRTPGSTKDYLSWLEDVDLIGARSKRYSLDDPLVRLYVRLYGRPVPPTDDEIVREVRAYAAARLVPTAPESAPPSASPAEIAPEVRRSSGIVEID